MHFAGPEQLARIGRTRRYPRLRQHEFPCRPVHRPLYHHTRVRTAVPGAAADAPLGGARPDPRRSPSSPLPAPSPLESAPEPSSLHATVLRLRTALIPVPDCARVDRVYEAAASMITFASLRNPFGAWRPTSAEACRHRGARASTLIPFSRWPDEGVRADRTRVGCRRKECPRAQRRGATMHLTLGAGRRHRVGVAALDLLLEVLLRVAPDLQQPASTVLVR